MNQGKREYLAMSGRQIGRLMAWSVIVAPAIVDWLHGFMLIEMGFGLVAGAYRFTLLVLGIGLLLLRPSKPVLLVSLAYAVCMLSLYLSWATMSQLLLLAELKSTVNVFFLPACFFILAFSYRYLELSKQTVIDYLLLYGRITALIVISSLIFDIGVPTYSSTTGDVYGFGTQSYYIAGNVLGLTLVVTLAVALIRLLRHFDARRLLDALLLFAGAFCVGSRTGMVISTALFVLFILYFIFFSPGQYRWRFACAVVLIPMIVVGGIQTYKLVSKYSRMTSKVQSLVAGEVRSAHSDPAWQLVESKPLANKIVGSSYQVHVREFASLSPKKNVETAIAESDPVDVIGSYGWIGLIILYLPYAVSMLKAMADYLLSRQLLPLIAFSGLAMLAGHSVIAGHVVLNSKSTQFACIFMFLALSGQMLVRRLDNAGRTDTRI